ncbi:MAG: glycerophosphodiester phosphodiesterase family protein, partial [Sphaerochaeta sp.]|nr:glycerophosphodiester phosphodiesterase family protein [Sphaerochaeta sp.]
WLSCARIKQLAPHIPCGILLEDKAVKNLAPLMHKMGMDYFHPDKMLLDEKTVQQCKEQHVGLNVWTVNDRDSLQQLIAWDVEGVITNHPDFCLEYLHK